MSERLCMEGPGLNGLFRNVKTSLTQGSKMSHVPHFPLKFRDGNPSTSHWPGSCHFLLSTWTCCSLSKRRIWIRVTIIYLDFTLMEYSCLEPLEIFVQNTQTSRSYFLALHRISTWPRSGSVSRCSENIWWVTVSDTATVPTELGDVATLSLQGLVIQPLSLQSLVTQILTTTVLWGGRQQQLLDVTLPMLCGFSSYTFLDSVYNRPLDQAFSSSAHPKYLVLWWQHRDFWINTNPLEKEIGEFIQYIQMWKTAMHQINDKLPSAEVCWMLDLENVFHYVSQ
jgi:hypothetical protein